MTKRIKRRLREHFARTADEQFAKFEREERALRRAERDERAARLQFPSLAKICQLFKIMTSSNLIVLAACEASPILLAPAFARRLLRCFLGHGFSKLTPAA